jgi:hypothetical protein
MSSVDQELTPSTSWQIRSKLKRRSSASMLHADKGRRTRVAAMLLFLSSQGTQQVVTPSWEQTSPPSETCDLIISINYKTTNEIKYLKRRIYKE